MGLFYADVPRGLRSSRWFGAAYGLLIWAAYEAGIAPLLDIRRRRRAGGAATSQRLPAASLRGP